MGALTTPYLNAANAGFLLVGEDSIASHTVGTTSSTKDKLITYLLEKAVKRVLMEYGWNTASTWKQFDSDDDGTLPETNKYTSAYNLPSDFVRLTGAMKVNGREIDPENEQFMWAISGSLLLTNQTPLEIQYVQYIALDNANTSTYPLWDKNLMHLIAVRFAADIAYSVTSDSRLRELLERDYEKFLSLAVLADSANSPKRAGRRGVMLNARYKQPSYMQNYG